MDSTQKIVTTHPIISTYIWHSSFKRPDAESTYGRDVLPPLLEEGRSFHHADEQRSIAKRMHFAAFRWSASDTEHSRASWIRQFTLTRDTLAENSLGIPHSVVRSFPYRLIYRFELLAECRAEMIEAIPSFDPWRGPPLSSWLWQCLRNACVSIVRRGDRHRCNASTEIILDELRAPSPVSGPAQDLVAEIFRPNNHTLTGDEKCYLESYFGLNGRTQMTQTELAKRFGVSQSAVGARLAGIVATLRWRYG